MTRGSYHESGRMSVTGMACRAGALALALLLVGPATTLAGATDGAGAAIAGTAGASAAADGQDAGGAERIWGSWKTQADRTGVTVFHGQDGSLRIVTSYYEVDLPAEFVARGVSFCYDDTVDARAEDSGRAEDRDTWRYAAAHLQVTTDDHLTWGVLLSKNGSELPDEAFPYVPHQQVRDLGEAAVGGGWHVVAYAFPFPDEVATGWEEVAQGNLDKVCPWVVARGSSSEAPEIPNDLAPTMGG